MDLEANFLKRSVVKPANPMGSKSCLRYQILLFCFLVIHTLDIPAQNIPSAADSTFYRQKIAELDSALAINGIGNSRVYDLAAYHSLLGEKEASLSYLQMAVENGLIILNAIVDPDLENVRAAEEWPDVRKKIIGNWYKYYPFGDADYALELIVIRDNYLRLYEEINDANEEYGEESDEYNAAITKARRLAVENGKELDSLINLHGWPRQNFVGQAQTRAAALVLVYSEVNIQKKYLHEIEKAVEYNEIEGRYLAIIRDKILISEGEKQLYGTQYLYNDSTEMMEIAPIENEIDIDRRRVELGMDSMDVYLERLNVNRK